MTQTQRARYSNAMNGKLRPLLMGDRGGAEVVGPQSVMFKTPQGQVQFDMGYLAMIVLQHNKLLGQDPVAVSIGIRGLIPPEDAFRGAVEPLLEECRRIRDKHNNPPLDDGAAAAVEAAELEKSSAAFRARLDETREQDNPVVKEEPAKPKAVRTRASHFK